MYYITQTEICDIGLPAEIHKRKFSSIWKTNRLQIDGHFFLIFFVEWQIV